MKSLFTIFLTRMMELLAQALCDKGQDNLDGEDEGRIEEGLKHEGLKH
ncbi:MAG: hypothetical protein QNJ22_16185 [Desulfosarcinaceae bacterium]|nr:hypothetical protein [Desulfosarcinaceae bacterium]